ncbi:pyridoxamine 5'-phosphate oxidase family protein [Limosilactobacillus kribbianus]|uniref:pyridoxamine 5'-phosphate oxidase family protein n=1 Tax=Limosilactobacillus kribbianus TaxID=2982695 RepID=UPI002263F0BD|nr:pyridoxamine 5'-phosphate oxidase family protein [Limosilactobacillus kribbianus]
MRNDVIYDHAKISWILDQCKILHLGLTNERGNYVVPVHYGYQEGVDGQYTIYIHGTGDGEKAAALDRGKLIGLEADGGHQNLIYTPPRASAFGPSFMSVIGNGIPRRLTAPQEKLVAARVLLHHYVNELPVAISQTDLQHVAIWAIEVQNITGRIHNPMPEWSTALGLPVKQRYGKHYEHGAVVKDDSAKLDLDQFGAPDATTSASQQD